MSDVKVTTKVDVQGLAEAIDKFARFTGSIAAPIEAIREEASKSRKVHQGRPKKTGDHVTVSFAKTGESADRIGSLLGMSGATVKRVDRLEREEPKMLEVVARGEKGQRLPTSK